MIACPTTANLQIKLRYLGTSTKFEYDANDGITRGLSASSFQKTKTKIVASEVTEKVSVNGMKAVLESMA